MSVLSTFQQNNDTSAIYKHRFRDGIKDPAEIDALRERHIQQAKQNQLLQQQVAENKRRKEEANRKKKAEELAEEQRLQREREELKKQQSIHFLRLSSDINQILICL